MINRIPAGGVVPTESQASRIETLTETGRMSHAEATNAVLGVMPKDVFDGEPAVEAPAEVSDPVRNIDHNVRAGNLINVYRVSLGLGPKIAKIAGLKGEERSGLEREIRRDKRSRDHFMENACAACPHQDDCEIKDDGFEGLMDVHPQLKPSQYEDVVYETETLQEMIIRISNKPGEHCDPAYGKEDPNSDIKPIAITEDEAFIVPMDDEGDRLEADLELRNIHLDKADKALGQRNSVDRRAKISTPEKTGRLAEESNELFEVFADELEQACSSCSHRGDCELASDPVAWEESKHYARSPDQEWEDSISDDGVKNESREQWRKRRKNDPNASCVPDLKTSMPGEEKQAA